MFLLFVLAVASWFLKGTKNDLSEQVVVADATNAEESTINTEEKELNEEEINRNFEQVYSKYLIQQNLPTKAKYLDWQIIDEIDLKHRIPYFEYKIGTAEFKIFHEGDVGLARIEIYNNGERFSDSRFSLATEFLNMFSKILTLKYEDNYYIFLQEWTGGAHCCYPEYVFMLNKNNELKFIKELKFGDDSSFSKDNFIEKDGNLYIRFTDSRFRYFHACFACSFFFDQYLLVDGENFIVRNFDFKDEFIKKAEQCENKLSDYLKEDSKEFRDLGDWSPVLTCKAVNYLLAGERKKAWEDFDSYFEKLPNNDFMRDSVRVSSEEFKLEIKKDLILTNGFLDQNYGDELLEVVSKRYLGGLLDTD